MILHLTFILFKQAVTRAMPRDLRITLHDFHLSPIPGILHLRRECVSQCASKEQE